MARRVIDSNLAHYALQGIEAAIEKLQRQAAELRRMVTVTRNGRRRRGRVSGTQNAADAKSAPTRSRRRRRMSAEARRRISEAQKARWARQKRGG